MGTQKNRLNEMHGSFENPKHMFKLMDKKISQFYAYKFLPIWTYVVALVGASDFAG